MDALPEGVKQFLSAADLPTVISIAVLTYLVQISLFTRLGWDHAIVWVPFVFSFILTPIMSSADEVAWGGKYYYRSVMYNGAVGLFAWHVVLPQIRAKYPQWFETKGAGNETLPPPPVLPPAA